MWTRILALAVAILVTGTSATALAAPITSISGAYLSGPTPPSGTVINYSVGVGGTAAPPLTNIFALGYTASDLTIDLTAFGADLGPVTISSPFVLTDPGTPGTAVFSVTNPGVLDITGPSSGIVTTVVTLVSNSTGLALGPPGSVWSFELTFNGLLVTPGSPGQYLTQPTSSASFSLNELAAVPEPSSFAVWGSLLAIGWLARRRLGQTKP